MVGFRQQLINVFKVKFFSKWEGLFIFFNGRFLLGDVYELYFGMIQDFYSRGILNIEEKYESYFGKEEEGGFKVGLERVGNRLKEVSERVN